jgi:hypothetical protein
VTDPIKLLAYRVLDHFKAETKMETKAVAKPHAKADASKPDPKAGDPTPDAKSDSQPKAKAAPTLEAKAEPKPAAKPASTSVLDKTLGEVLLAGMAKDPEDSGRVIAAALTQADGPAAATPAPETKDKSAPNAEASQSLTQAPKSHRR